MSAKALRQFWDEARSQHKHDEDGLLAGELHQDIAAQRKFNRLLVQRLDHAMDGRSGLWAENL